jgi:hypothetical protein
MKAPTEAAQYLSSSRFRGLGNFVNTYRRADESNHFADPCRLDNRQISDVDRQHVQTGAPSYGTSMTADYGV